MRSDEKIVVTGVSGDVAFPFAEVLAVDNERSGLARFTHPGFRMLADQAGARPIVAAINSGGLDDVPTDLRGAP